MDEQETREEARPKRSPLVTITALVLVLGVVFMFARYGTVSPCGALKKRIKAMLIESAANTPTSNVWEQAGRSLGLALAGPMVDAMVDSLNPGQCISSLYRLETQGNQFFGDLMASADAPASTASDDESDYDYLFSDPAGEDVPARDWRTWSSQSPIDDSTNVFLNREAENRISRRLGDPVRPDLLLRCKENKTEAYITLKVRPDREYGRYGSSYANVTLRFDDEPAFREKMSLSTDGEAIFFPRPISYIKRMANHDQLLLQFTPSSSSPQIVTFDLTGLSAKLPALRGACHW
jgi:type VI secretion system protein VasI